MKRKKVAVSVFGILSTLGSGKVQRAVREVLTRIKERHPRDFEVVRKRVREIRPLFGKWRRKGTLGVWLADEGGNSSFDFTSTGVIGLALTMSHATAVVAHEFGHVCTREADFARREGADSEWASEMCADYYAYKWGFGAFIARQRSQRDFGHHGPTPGSEFTIEHGSEKKADRILYRYRVTRSFMFHLVQTETPDGRVIETAAQIEEHKRRQMDERQKEWERRSKSGLSQNGGLI